MEKLYLHLPPKGVICSALFLLLSVINNIILLFQSPVAVGNDGYYYVIQVNTFLNRGDFYFSSQTPFVLWVFSFLALIWGDTVSAIKIGAIIFHVLLNSGLLILIFITTRNIWLGLLSMIIESLSNLHRFLIGEFLNNSGALVFLIWSFICIVRFFQTKKKGWLISFLFTLIGAVFSHRSIIPLLLMICASSALAYLYLYSTKRKEKIYAILLFGFAFLLPLFLSWQSVFKLPIWIESNFLKFPQMPFWSVSVAESSMLMLALGIFILLCWRIPESLKQNEEALLFLSVMVLSLLTTLNPFLDHTKGFLSIVGRFDSLAFLQTAIVIPTLFAILIKHSRRGALIFSLIFSILLFWSFFTPLPLAMRKGYLQKREKLVQELPEMRKKMCIKPLVIAKHGEQFLVTAISGISSQQKIPVHNEYECVYWLIHQPEIEYSLIFAESVVSVSGDFILVKDSAMRKAFEEMNNEERRLFMLSNPHLQELINVGRSNVR